MSAQLRYFLKNFADLSETELEEIVSKFSFRNVARGQYLLKAGEVCSDFVFVQSGCIRMYYLSRDLEISAWFSMQDSVAMEVHSFISGTPSICFLEAIEPSEVWVLAKKDIEMLYRTTPVMQEIMRKIWEAALQLVIPRFASLQNESAEERYLHLLQQPELMQHIPQKYLASFIGVTPTSLSRIRRQIAKTAKR